MLTKQQCSKFHQGYSMSVQQITQLHTLQFQWNYAYLKTYYDFCKLSPHYLINLGSYHWISKMWTKKKSFLIFYIVQIPNLWIHIVLINSFLEDLVENSSYYYVWPLSIHKRIHIVKYKSGEQRYRTNTDYCNFNNLINTLSNNNNFQWF